MLRSRFGAFWVVDAAAETLALKHADLALHHVEPTGVLRGEVEFEAAQDTSGLGGREGLIQRPRLVDRQIVLHDTDTGGAGIVDVDEFAHAARIVYGGAALGDLDVAPARCGSKVTKRLAVPLRRYS